MMVEEILQKVEKSLDSIRPYLQDDGGDVEVVSLTEDMKLTVEFVGACSSCNMSNMTFKAGIEEAIKRDVPEITEVIPANAAEMVK
jgi:Fe-S cluster biogenesis protein NfuA